MNISTLLQIKEVCDKNDVDQPGLVLTPWQAKKQCNLTGLPQDGDLLGILGFDIFVKKKSNPYVAEAVREPL